MQVNSENCSICLEPIIFKPEDPKSTTALKCGHIFHESCVGKWLKTNATCPTCRCVTTDSLPSTSKTHNLSTSNHFPPAPIPPAPSFHPAPSENISLLHRLYARGIVDESGFYQMPTQSLGTYLPVGESTPTAGSIVQSENGDFDFVFHTNPHSNPYSTSSRPNISDLD
jgi:hypothetical protein